LSEPGQDQHIATAFFDYQKAGTVNDTGVYIAGDCVSWTSGWTEGALTTGLNAAAAVITSLGGNLNSNYGASWTPMSFGSQYNYLG
jgi:tryptophan 2-monooxygenase